MKSSKLSLLFTLTAHVHWNSHISGIYLFSVLQVYCYQPISLHPHACVLSHVTPSTAARHAPLSMDFSRQKYWNGLPFPSPYFRYLIVTYGNHYHNGQYRRNLIPCFRLGWAEGEYSELWVRKHIILSGYWQLSVTMRWSGLDPWVLDHIPEFCCFRAWLPLNF